MNRPAPNSESRVDSGLCKHCGLPSGSNDFCCLGCEVVYDGIQKSGLGDMYYRLREVSPSAVSAGPVGDEILRTPTELEQADFSDAVRKSLTSASKISCSLTGLHCSACGWLVNQVAYSVEGVTGVQVNTATGRATFQIEDEATALKLRDTLRRVGIGLSLSKTSPGNDHRKLLTRAGVSWAIAGNVMLLSFALYAGLDASQPRLYTFFQTAIMLLGTVSVLYGGGVFFKKAIASIRYAFIRRSPLNLHMDVPVSLGILVGYFYSVISVMSGEGIIWMDSISVLIAALLTARWLLAKSMADAQERVAIPDLPRVARAVVDGTPTFVPIDSINPADLIQIEDGEMVPVDGVILSGRSSLINSMITGEAIPVAVEPGDEIEAGAVNSGATLLVRAARRAGESRLAGLLQWLQEGGHQSRVEHMAHRLAGVFTAAVLLIAGVSGVSFWVLGIPSGLTRIVALLVVSCPCALGMAMPIALAMANKRASASGVFVKGSDTIESLASIETAVFDKTGTLTQGAMQLVDWAGDPVAIDWAVSAERDQAHPIARALVTAWHAENVVVPTLSRSVPGRGIEAEIENNLLRVGAMSWVASFAEGQLTAELRNASISFEKRQLSVIAISVNDSVQAVLGFGDSIREQAGPLVQAFREDGIAMMIASGDNAASTRAVSDHLGIGNFVSEVDPMEKQQLIESLESTGRVMMVGDGINDAAALRAATVGIAFDGHAASMAAADVFVTSTNLDLVRALHPFSSRVMRIVKQNIGVSLLYNACFASLALAGFVTPLVAAIAMPISSIYVVLSSSRIRRLDLS